MAGKPRKNTTGEEIRPDAWKRFERAVDIALHTQPLHQPSKKKPRARRKTKKSAD